MTSHTERRSTLTVILACTLAGLLPLLVGLVVSIFTIDYRLRQAGSAVVGHAITYFDDLFDTLQRNASHEQRWLTVGCAELSHLGPGYALYSPSLGHQQVLANDCTAAPEAAFDATAAALHLQLGSVHGQGAQLQTIFGNGQRAIRTTLQTQDVARWMKLISGDVQLRLRIGDALLWDDGALLHGSTTDSNRFTHTRASLQWPYELTSTLGAGEVIDAIVNELIRLLGPLSVVAVLCAGLCHWSMTRRY